MKPSKFVLAGKKLPVSIQAPIFFVMAMALTLVITKRSPGAAATADSNGKSQVFVVSGSQLCA